MSRLASTAIAAILSAVAIGGCGEGSTPSEFPNPTVFSDSEICNVLKDGRPCWIATTLVDPSEEAKLIILRENESLIPERAFCRSLRSDPRYPNSEEFRCVEYTSSEEASGARETKWGASFLPLSEGGEGPIVITELTHDDGDGIFDSERFRDESKPEMPTEPEDSAEAPDSFNSPGPGPNLNQSGVGQGFTSPNIAVPPGTAKCRPGFRVVGNEESEMCVPE